MRKPPLPDFQRLQVHIARYRQALCREVAGLDQRLRQGKMHAVAFAELAAQYSWIWFDAYGVLNRGSEPVPGAGDTLNRLRAAGIPFCMVSNNASFSPEDIQTRLGAMGIHMAMEEIVTVGMAVKDFVRENNLDDQPYLWVGDQDSARCYAPQPQRLMVNHPQSSWRQEDARYVLFSGNQEYYGGIQEKILLASAQKRSLTFLLANADLVAPEALGSLNMVAGFTACEANIDGRFSVMGVGKPFRPVFELAWKRCGCPPWHQVLMVGDALETDILGGGALGMATCLTLTGLYGPMEGELEQVCDRVGIRPDYVVRSIGMEGQ
ncbi:MAG: hypothetical protein HW380_1727 [Magnetococcales bacterium]|nr:hypothetical protein [Magnetococcales bacterium]HIJ82864.1 HAD hydrolase-like protein [Magnetococcales bacterium]